MSCTFVNVRAPAANPARMATIKLIRKSIFAVL
jgi:hypothetical protein